METKNQNLKKRTLRIEREGLDGSLREDKQCVNDKRDWAWLGGGNDGLWGGGGGGIGKRGRQTLG